MLERTRARSWALCVLYAWEARGKEIPLRDVLWEFLRERRINESRKPYLRTLITTLAEHVEEIDATVQASLTNWRLERLGSVDRNILRLAAAEMLYIEDVPPKVSIQEAIVLAEKYGTRDSPRFVNGVLDAMLRRLEGRG